MNYVDDVVDIRIPIGEEERMSSEYDDGSLAISAPVSTNNLKKLRGVHGEILRLHHMGVKSGEIAKTVGKCEGTVNYTIQSVPGQERLRELQLLSDNDSVEIAKKLRKIAPEAVDMMKSIMLDEVEDEHVSVPTRLRAAESLLDRGGWGKVTKSNITIKDDSQIVEEIKARAVEIGLIPGDSVVLEAEVVANVS